MFRYGLPNSLPLLGRGDVKMSSSEADESDRRGLVGVVGLVLFALGSAVQITNVMLG